MGSKLEQVSVRLIKDADIYSDKEIKNAEDAVRIIGKELLAELDREALCIVNLKSNGVPINFNIASIGSINQSLVTVRELMKSAVLSNAANAIILHNHPSGNVTPSKNDIATTKKLLNAFKMMDIELLDHIIVAGGESEKIFSMRENKVLDFKNYRVNFDDEISFNNLGVNIDPLENTDKKTVNEDVELQEYTVTIREVLERKVTVRATSFWDAENIVQEKYQKEEIVLTADDFLECDLFCREDSKYFNPYTDINKLTDEDRVLYFGNKSVGKPSNRKKSIEFDR